MALLVFPSTFSVDSFFHPYEEISIWSNPMPPVLEPLWFSMVRICSLLDFSWKFLADTYASFGFNFLYLTKSGCNIQYFVVVFYFLCLCRYVP